MSFKKAIQQFNEVKEPITYPIPGEIGITIDGQRVTEVPTRGQFVYVRIRSDLSEVIQAFNDKVFPGYGLPVIIKWQNNRYEVIGRDVQRYPEWEEGNPFIARHGETHSLDKEGGNIGSDPVWVYPYQFMPSLVVPFNSDIAKNVYINPSPVLASGEWKYLGNTGTPDLLPYRPYSGSSLVLISFDTVSGNPALFASTGTYIPNNVTGSNQFVDYLPAVDPSIYIPLSYVKLVSGTSNIGWENLYDVRQFFAPNPTGSSYLNVNGAYPISRIETEGATFSSTGTVAFLEFIGGSGISGSFGNPFVSFEIDGTLETGTSMALPYLVSSDYDAEYAYLYLEYLGITGTTKVDIKKNGISIFTGGYTLDIPYSFTGSWIRAVPYYNSYVTGDIFTLDILQKADGVYGLRTLVTPVASSPGGGITVEEVDGNPSVSKVTKIIVPNDTVKSNGGGQITLYPFPNIEVLNITTAAKTTTSASYVDHDATNSILSFTKLSDDTDVLINLFMSMYSTAVYTILWLGVYDGTNDHDVVKFSFNTANTHLQTAGVQKITGLTAGSYTFKLRWKRISGAGTIVTDANDHISMSAQEVQG